MIITDLTLETPLNQAVNLNLPALHQGIANCLSLIATGTISEGTPKLTVSQDEINFYPLYDFEGKQIEIESGKPIFLNFADLFLKVDLTDVSSEDLKISIQ